MDVKNELREIRIQMASDFDFTALALKDMGQRFRAGMTDTARSLEAMGREMEERFNQVEGRTRLQEQRFQRMLAAVEVAVDEWKPEVQEIKARLERLERKVDPAA